MRLVWTQEVLERLDDIQYYLAIGQKAPQAAQDMLRRILVRAQQIQELPLNGRKVLDYHNPDIREQIENPYRVIYLITDDTIYLLSIMHQRQLLPKVKEMKAAAEMAIKAVQPE